MSRRPLLGPAAALLAAWMSLAYAAAGARADPPAESAPAPQGYEVLRFWEDWSALVGADRCARKDWSDGLKVLAPASGLRLAVGGQARLRFESYENFEFRADEAADDSWWLTRVRLHGDLRLGGAARIFVEGIYADQEYRDLGPRAIDENHGDFLNAFAEYAGRGCGVEFGVRVGRQELLFGRQRLIGPLPGANTRRSFDGISAWAEGAGWRVDGFCVRPVVVAIDGWDEADDGVGFAGAYFSHACGREGKVEAYALYSRRDAASWLGVTTDDERVTLGGAASGPLGRTRFDYDVEAAYQAGSAGDGDVSAWFATAELGWRPRAPCWDPRLALGVDYASGDDDGPGGDVGTFDQLFATGHLWFGFIDLVGRQNLVAGRLTATAYPREDLMLRADLHGFWRASTQDSLYNSSGRDIRMPLGSGSAEIGSEIDILLKWTPDRHWEYALGWAHVFAGDFISETGASEDVDSFWFGVTYTF